MEELLSRSPAWDRRFAHYAWSVLAYNLLVILWGAVVRATGSGAGCGEHWPLCQGVVIPHAAQIATLIEFAHRASSGIAVVLVVLLLVFAFRQFPSGHAARRCSTAALTFTVTEGLIGAALVLFGQVGTNASLSRAWMLSFHLTNTFLLLASLALTAKSGGNPLSGRLPISHHRNHRGMQRFFSANSVPSVVNNSSNAEMKPSLRVFLWHGAGLLGALAMAVTGTVAALGDTLFHATSLAQGFQLDFSASPNPLLRLRIIHPLIAVAAGAYLIFLGIRALGSPLSPTAKHLAHWLVALVTVQFLLGVLNLVLLAPLGMQLLHLLTADLVWITLVLLSAEVLKSRQPAVSVETPEGWAPEIGPQAQPEPASTSN
jgi:heme A synthase